MGNPDAVLYTVPEALSLLRVSRTTLYQLISRGELRTVTIGRSRRVCADSLIAFVDRHSVGGAA